MEVFIVCLFLYINRVIGALSFSTMLERPKLNLADHIFIISVIVCFLIVKCVVPKRSFCIILQCLRCLSKSVDEKSVEGVEHRKQSYVGANGMQSFIFFKVFIMCISVKQ